MRQSAFTNYLKLSPLQQQKRVRSGGQSSSHKSLLFNMNLTTLIDAFCILVIFLLSNMNGQLQNLQIGKNMTLPAAVGSDTMQTGVVVRMESTDLFVDDKKISGDELVKVLIASKTKEKKSLIIQADRNADYDKISLLLRAGAQAGFDTYAFAVLPGAIARKE